MMNTSNFSQGAAWVDGEIVPISEASISILDNGFLHSDATYDVAHVWKGRFFRLTDHLDRFFSGMEQLYLSMGFDQQQVQAILMDCVRTAGFEDAYVEMICTRGVSPDGSRDPRDCENKFFAFALPFVWIADSEKRQRGLHLIITDIERINPAAVNPVIKNYHWLDLVMALYQAYEKGGETALVIDSEQNVVEGPGFNIFVLKNNELITPDKGALLGVTRATVLELARTLDLSVSIRQLHADEVRQAHEVFITSTAGGVIPITRVDQLAITNGLPGRVTQQLQKAYWDLHLDDRYSLSIQY